MGGKLKAGSGKQELKKGRFMKLDLPKPLRLARNEEGSALVEFAMTVPLLTLLFFGVLQGMFAMYIYHYTAYAAQQGARFAVVHGASFSANMTYNCSTSAPPNFTMQYGCTARGIDIQNYVQSLGAINPNRLTINTTDAYLWPGTNPDGTTAGCGIAKSKGCLVRVTASYSFNFVPFLPFTGLTMSATSEKAILQ